MGLPITPRGWREAGSPSRPGPRRKVPTASSNGVWALRDAQLLGWRALTAIVRASIDSLLRSESAVQGIRAILGARPRDGKVRIRRRFCS